MEREQGIRGWILWVAVAWAFVSLPAVATEKDLSQDKAAVVNGSVITQAAFDRELGLAKRRFEMGGTAVTEAQLSAIRQETLQRLIDMELLYQESQNKGIKVDEAELDKKLKMRFPNEAEFKQIVEKMHVTEAELKSQFLRGMAIQSLIEQEIAQKVTVSDKEIKEYYDSHAEMFKEPEQAQASHILIKVDPKADPSQKAEARKKMEEIQEKLKKGEDFLALAREISQCPSSAKGGDLGYFRRGQMVKPFEEVAFSLKPGEVSDIVETKFGYHLIKGGDKKPEGLSPYEDVKDRIMGNLKREKVQKEIDAYLARLKDKAKVERFLSEAPQ